MPYSNTPPCGHLILISNYIQPSHHSTHNSLSRSVYGSVCQSFSYSRTSAYYNTPKQLIQPNFGGLLAGRPGSGFQREHKLLLSINPWYHIDWCSYNSLSRHCFKINWAKSYSVSNAKYYSLMKFLSPNFDSWSGGIPLSSFSVKKRNDKSN